MTAHIQLRIERFAKLMTNKNYFCKNLFHYSKRQTTEVKVGNVCIGGDNPIRIQTMVTTQTSDIDATVQECIKVAIAGAELIRITTPTIKDVEALAVIKKKFNDKGYNIPLVADIHFNSDIADAAAKVVEKIRINPGNYTDKQARLTNVENNEQLWEADLETLRVKFVALLNICKKHGTALRIGTNHGSLSGRIMAKYGDTPEGMVESAMEFLRICKSTDFNNVVVSMKASNTRIMVHAYRLLVAAMEKEDMHYPLHLGVTEAGDGEDGRIKSAVGIGTLLADGLGDTIRVSLTEPPENEIPIARNLVEYFKNREKHNKIDEIKVTNFDPYHYNKSKSNACGAIGGENQFAVIADLSSINPIYQKDIDALMQTENNSPVPDYIYTGSSVQAFNSEELNIIDDNDDNFIFCDYSMMSSSFMAWLKKNTAKVLIVSTDNTNSVAEQRAFLLKLNENKIANPVIIHRSYTEPDFEKLQLMASCDFGALLIDGFGAGIMLSTNTNINPKKISDLCFRILQASRVRYTRTEYIACPGCGRTLFDLKETLQKIKEATSCAKSLKIGVMGCIVNGPGEMADADYGYVGAGVGKITLYKGQEPVKKNIPQENAIEELIKLIKPVGER